MLVDVLYSNMSPLPVSPITSKFCRATCTTTYLLSRHARQLRGGCRCREAREPSPQPRLSRFDFMYLHDTYIHGHCYLLQRDVL